MKKIERQPNQSTSRPPMLGPMAGASTTPMPNRPARAALLVRLEGAQHDDGRDGLHHARRQPFGDARASTTEKCWPARRPMPPHSSSTMVPT
jgi:hypothetical protein